ncbi:MAG: adenylate/guanylate cyclase domain-containing protein [Lentisphaerae bacterium]|nr:adenylate/guanylate cyclase domain-containing protein [Lentisphaerota bacterium]
MTAVLHVKHGSEEHEHPCSRLVMIGRHEANHLVLAEDLKASRNHALVRCLGDGQYYVMDVGSANGTFVNGKRVFVPCALTDGDKIEIGNHILVFRHEAGPVVPLPTETNIGANATLTTLGRTVQTLTVLVADIRDYTRLSQQISPELLAAVLGRWFRAAGDVVEKNGGTVDKFIGDAMMARWLSPEEGTGVSVAAAMKTAQDLDATLQEVNAGNTDLPQPLKIGVGINSGAAVLANVGVRGSRDYTALGDAVNVAFRLEKETKTLKSDVVVGSDACEHLPKALWENRLQSVRVKGKLRALSVLSLTFNELGGVMPLLTDG